MKPLQMKNLYLLLFTVAFALASCKSSKYADLGDGLFADIKTNMGDVVVKLEYEKTPVTVANFVSLAEGKNTFVAEEFKGKKYYDGLTFHRIMKDFMIQGGDPTGTGSGSPGYKFKDEFHDSLTHYKAGILSMANSGPKTNGSQFFITHKETPWLDGKHSVFGEVVEGMAVVDSIANVTVGAQNRPESPVTMNTVEIIRNGRDAKKFKADKVLTAYFAEEERILAAKKKLLADTAAAFKTDEEKATALPSGLKTLTLTEGTGTKPAVGQKVMVKYAGYLSDGTLFDSNYEDVLVKFDKFDERMKAAGRYEPTPMDYSPDASLIAGFKEGLMTMKVGDKVRLFIPPHLGYGEQNYGPIPGGSNLVFDIEITGMAETKE